MTRKIICLMTAGALFFGSINVGTTASRIALASLTNHATGHTHHHDDPLNEEASDDSDKDNSSLQITTYHHHHAPGSPEHQHARTPFAVTVSMDSTCSTLPSPVCVHFIPRESVASFSACAQPLSLSFELILRPPIS